MAFARQIFRTKIVDLSDVGDPEFMERDPCLHCTLDFGCDERHPKCAYQNELTIRTVPVEPILAMPVALARQREKRRESWKVSKRRDVEESPAINTREACTTA